MFLLIYWVPGWACREGRTPARLWRVPREKKRRGAYIYIQDGCLTWLVRHVWCWRIGCKSVVETELEGICAKCWFNINSCWTMGHVPLWDLSHTEHCCRPVHPEAPKTIWKECLRVLSDNALQVWQDHLRWSSQGWSYQLSSERLHLSREPFFPKVHSSSNTIGTQVPRF